MKRVAITFTLEADLDGVPGWGDKPSDWVDLVQQRVCTSDTYKPEIKVHEIMEKRYGYEDGKGYVRPKFITVADRFAKIEQIMGMFNANSEIEVIEQRISEIENALAEGSIVHDMGVDHASLG